MDLVAASARIYNCFPILRHFFVLFSIFMSFTHLLVHSSTKHCLPDFRWKKHTWGAQQRFELMPLLKAGRRVTGTLLHKKLQRCIPNELLQRLNKKRYDAPWKSYATTLVIYVSHLLRFGAPLFWGLPYRFLRCAAPYIELHVRRILFESYFLLLLSYAAWEDYSRKIDYSYS